VSTASFTREWHEAIDACPQQTACPNQMGLLQLQLSLPGASQNLGRPERIAAARAQDLLRARSTYAGNALSHRKGWAYGYNAMLDLKKDGQTRASIERGPMAMPIAPTRSPPTVRPSSPAAAMVHSPPTT
jgi:hypothetical protein